MNLRPHHTAISVRDLVASQQFYEALGYRQVHRYDEEDGSMAIVHLKLGESFLEIFWYAKNATEEKVEYEHANNLKDIGVKHIGLQAEDIRSTLEELQSLGIASEDTEIKSGRTKIDYFFVQDPDGVWVEFVEDKRDY